MTDTAAHTPETDAAPEHKEGRDAAIQVLARALWREQLVAPASDKAEGEAEDAAKPDRAEWKEKRKDYIKLATKLYKRLDRQGATLSASADKAGEDAEAEAE